MTAGGTYTESDLDLLWSDLSHRQVGEALGRTAKAIEHKRARLGVPARVCGWGAYATTCHRGHDLVDANIYVRPDGTRECRACRELHKSYTPRPRVPRTRCLRNLHEFTPENTGFTSQGRYCLACNAEYRRTHRRVALTGEALERKRAWDREYRRTHRDTRRRRYAEDPEYRRRELERHARRGYGAAATPEARAARRLRDRGRPRARRRTPYVHPNPEAERARRRAWRQSPAARRREALLRAIPAPRNWQPWTAEDDAVVVRDDISQVEMAYLLGRSYAAVSGRRSKVRFGHTKELKGAFSDKRRCAVCGKKYTAKSPAARYCSPSCKRTGDYTYRRDWDKKGLKEIACRGCGKRVIADPRAKFCTKQCKRAYHYLKEVA